MGGREKDERSGEVARVVWRTSGEGAGCLMKSEVGGAGAVRGRPGVFMGENIMDGPLKCVT